MANKITAHNIETGEVVVRDLTKSEIDQVKIDKAEEATLKASAEAKATAKAAILDRIGLTADELKTILG
jgi:inosine/xanthosine triphosphate pyrophosphatase family protein